ncbi:Kelch domain containing 4 [Balamuthia mandrillaris]
MSNAMLDTTAEKEEGEEREEQSHASSLQQQQQGRLWGRLVAINKSFENVDLEEEEDLWMGRHKSCNPLCRFEEDRKISTKHCHLFREKEEEGTNGRRGVWLEDLSSNGTYLNGKKIGKGNRVALRHGDEISLVYPAFNTMPKSSQYAAYVFQDLTRSEETTKEEEEEENIATQPLDEEEGEEGAKANEEPQQQAEETTLVAPDEVADEAKTKEPMQATAATEEHDGNSPNKRKRDVDPSATNSAPSSSTTSSSSSSTTSSSSSTVDDEAERDRKKMKKMEAIYESELVCVCCHELLHKCVTLIPCLHNVCAYCYGEWRARSPVCPQCRGKVKGLSRNHAICNLIESYLEANPDKKRDEEELKDMDANSKITDEMLRNKISYRDDDEDEEDDEEEEEEEDDDGGDRYIAPAPVVTWGFPSMTLPSFGMSFFPRSPVCSECATARIGDGFKCPTGGAHHTCTSCLRPFPNRTDVPVTVQCELCHRYYCDNYWGCTTGVGSSLKPLSEHTFTSLPSNCLNHNQAEQDILLKYLSDQGKGVSDLWADCLNSLDSGDMIFSDVLTRINVQSTNNSCESCAQHVFKSLIYPYRSNIDAEDLPEEAKGRPDCHWGQNCRTQQHNISHAKRYNHICEQTRFA